MEALPCGTRTVIGQIHGKKEELVRLYVDNALPCKALQIYFMTDIGSKTGKETKFLLKNKSGEPLQIPLMDSFDYEIKPDNKNIKVYVIYKGDTYVAGDKIHHKWLKDQFYFKYGTYFQTTTKNLISVVSFGKVR